MGFHLAQIITQLGETVVLGTVVGQDELMDLCATPTSHLSAAMEQHFHQPNHTCVVDLDPWDFTFACDHRQGQPLEQRKVHVDVEALSLESRETVGDPTEDLAHRGKVIERFLQMKVREIVAAHFASKEAGELLVLFDKGVLEIGPQDVMPVLDPLKGSAQLALKLLGDALTKELGDFVSRQKPKAHIAGALKEFSDGEVALEDEVAA